MIFCPLNQPDGLRAARSSRRYHTRYAEHDGRLEYSSLARTLGA